MNPLKSYFEVKQPAPSSRTPVPIHAVPRATEPVARLRFSLTQTRAGTRATLPFASRPAAAEPFSDSKKLKGSRENAVVIEPAFSWASDSFAGRTSVTMEAENGNVTRDLHAELQKSTEVTVAVAVIRTLTRAIERSTATTVMGLEKVSDTKSFELQPYCATCAASLWRPEDFLHCGGVPCLSLLPSRIFFPPFALPETDPALPLCSPTLGRTQRTCTHPQRS